MWTAKSVQNDDHIILSAYLLIPTFLLVFALWAQHVVAKTKQNVITPVSVVLIIGMIVSAIANVCGAYNANHSQFQFANIELGSSVFYFALLPPIIHSSAYSVRRKDLLKNWDAVCLLAFLGSMISILVMTFVLQLVIQVFVPNLEVSVIELLTFSSLISSVDPPIQRCSLCRCISRTKQIYWYEYSHARNRYSGSKRVFYHLTAIFVARLLMWSRGCTLFERLRPLSRSPPRQTCHN